jgi:hypothetical protein
VRVQSRLAAFVFAAIVIAGIDAGFVRLFLDKHQADPTPPYELFLREVARRTTPGQKIAILVPDRGWARDYAYRYYRASYVLAGRRVIPLLSPDDAVHLDRLRHADLIAAWDVEATGHELLWRAHGGALYRRTR